MARRARTRARALLVTLITVSVVLIAAVDRPIAALPERALLVGVEPGADDAAVRAALRDYGAVLSGRIEELNLLVVRPRPGSAERTRQSLNRMAAVRYVELERPLQLATAVPTNDPFYLDGKQWNIDRLEVFKAWELLPLGQQTIVGVVDTGVDANHPDLSRRILQLGCDSTFQRGCSSSTDSVPRDIIGHGTHVSGIIGASPGNGIGVTSVGGDYVSILAVRVSYNASGYLNPSEAMSAIVYAINSGAKVINMSFGSRCGGPGSADESQAWRSLISLAEARDVLLVQAAGNEGGCELGREPGRDPRVLSVAAVNRDGALASFSNRGDWVSVAAPGVDVYSTCIAAIVCRGPYGSLSGTSMATPHVSALAALLYQVPGATRAKVIEWIKSTCDGTLSGVQCGGTVNAYRAVHLAVKGFDPAKAPITPAPQPEMPPAE